MQTFTLETPLPPLWLRFPNIPLGSKLWSTGKGEAYAIRFKQWFDSLNKQDQLEYQKIFPKPKNWIGAENTNLQVKLNDHRVMLWATKGEPSYSISKLLATIESAEHTEHRNYVLFWENTATKELSKSCLSQWWRSNFSDGRKYCCMEQYMMAEKTRLFGDAESEAQIMRSFDPKEIKALGRAVKGFDSTIWDQAKYAVVLNGNYLKFTQNQALMDFLLGTKNQILVEASPYDRIWGVGRSEQDKKIYDPGYWNGQNLLGFALMEVRDEIRRVYQHYDEIDWERVKA